MPRGVKKGLNSKKFDGCVTKVKRKSGKKVNPYAVCNASMSGKSKHRKKIAFVSSAYNFPSFMKSLTKNN